LPVAVAWSARESPGPIVACRHGAARRDFLENPGFSNHNSVYPAMRLRIEIMRHSANSTSERGLSVFGPKRAFFDLPVGA
jgi:hypothetical protein